MIRDVGYGARKIGRTGGSGPAGRLDVGPQFGSRIAPPFGWCVSGAVGAEFGGKEGESLLGAW